jgi:hypothetical protein
METLQPQIIPRLSQAHLLIFLIHWHKSDSKLMSEQPFQGICQEWGLRAMTQWIKSKVWIQHWSFVCDNSL